MRTAGKRAKQLTGCFGRVLIVEDNPVLRRALVRAARNWQAAVATASTRQHALSLLRAPLDLLVADVCLPDGSAHDLFRRAADLKPAPLLVAISGAASSSETFELGKLGVHAFLSKPFTSSRLAQCIEEALALHRSSQAEAGAPRTPVPRAVDERLRLFAERHANNDRQTEMVRLLVSGASRRELASALGVSENTCKTAVRRLLARCGATRSSEIVRRVLTSQTPAKK